MFKTDVSWIVKPLTELADLFDTLTTTALVCREKCFKAPISRSKSSEGLKRFVVNRRFVEQVQRIKQLSFLHFDNDFFFPSHRVSLLSV